MPSHTANLYAACMSLDSVKISSEDWTCQLSSLIYIQHIFATREPAEYNLQKLQSLIAYGGSPRASISLAKAARAYAFIRRRGYVIPEDVRAVCHDVLRHRIGLTYEAEAENITSEEIITEILNNVIVP